MSDVDRLQGKWRVVAARADGQDDPEAVDDHTLMEFTGGRVLIGHEDAVFEYDVHLDERDEPKWIDVVSPNPQIDFMQPAIYRIEGDALFLCFSVLNHGPRPARFSAERGEETGLYVLHRVPARDFSTESS